MDHSERELIDGLFGEKRLVPADWDRLFAHLRAGCEGCAGYYSERRAAAGADSEDMQLTDAESTALARVLVQRARGPRARRWPAWRWPALASVAAVAGAALLLARPDPETMDDARAKGGGGQPVGIKVLCAPPGAADSALVEAGAAGCVADGLLVVETLARAEVGASRVSLVVVDEDLRLLSFNSKNIRSDEPVHMQDTVSARAGKMVKVFVLWGRSLPEPEAVESALRKGRASGKSASTLSSLEVSGALAERSQLVRLRGADEP